MDSKMDSKQQNPQPLAETEAEGALAPTPLGTVSRFNADEELQAATKGLKTGTDTDFLNKPRIQEGDF
jgi:hypothetical protein